LISEIRTTDPLAPVTYVVSERKNATESEMLVLLSVDSALSAVQTEAFPLHSRL
jgi:hypothetical protein